MIPTLHAPERTPHLSPRRDGDATQSRTYATDTLMLTSLRDYPTQQYYRYLPRELDRAAPVLVSVHGISRNAREHALECVAIARGLRCALIAPLFSHEFCRGFQRLCLDRGAVRVDIQLDRIVQEVREFAQVLAAPIDLVGFSGGAQFAHRYALFHPQRVRRLVVASAGWYTMPDPALPFPYGLDRRALSLPSPDLRTFLAIPQLVAVGRQDASRDRNLRMGSYIDGRQGSTRLERAVGYTAELYRAAAHCGLPARARLHVIDGAGHDFRACMRKGLAAAVLRWLTADESIDLFDKANSHEA